MSLIKAIIIVAMVLLGWNLLVTVGNIEGSLLLSMSGEVISDNTNQITDTWAIRGQIGDILSGHFSALAFLAVALSIILQNEANKQMRESIDKQEEALEQQSEALKVQSKSLEAQIAELKASRKESSKQTEEFAISNMNIKLDRYYKLLNEIVEKTDEDTVLKYIASRDNIKKIVDETKFNERELLKTIETSKMDREGYCSINSEVRIRVAPFLDYHAVKTRQETLMNSIMQTLNHIYNDLEIMKLSYPDAYLLFIQELIVRLHTNSIYYDIYKTHEDAEKLCLAFRLFNSESPKQS